MRKYTHNRRLRHLLHAFLGLILIAYAWIAFETWRSTLEDTRQNLNHINSAQVQGLISTLNSHELVLKGLGYQLVKLGTLQQPERGRELLEKIKSLDRDMIGFGLARTDGQLVLVSGIKPGSKLPNLMDNAESRDSFNEVLRSNHIQLGRVYLMKALQQWAIPVRAPIHDEQGNTIAVMTAGYGIEARNTGWANMLFPPHVATTILRADGYLQFYYPKPETLTLEDIYLSPVHELTLQQVHALAGDSGFTTMYFPRFEANFYVSYTRIKNYDLLSATFTPRAVVLLNWLEKLVAPSILLLLSLLGGYWIYRRTENQQARAQQHIEKLTNWQRAVLDSADYSMISTDTNGIIVSFNSAAERMLGYRAEEMIGKQSPTAFHDAAEMEQYAAEQSRELGRPVSSGFEAFVAKARINPADEREWTYIRKDGSRFPVHLSITSIQDDRGNISGFLGVAADLTEYKRAQKSLRDSEHRYRNLFEGATDGIVVLNHSGIIIDCNPSALGMFGCSRQELLGSTPVHFSPEQQPDGSLSSTSAQQHIANAFGGRTETFDWLHKRMDGSTFHAAITLNVLQNNNDTLVLGTVRDISARKEAEEKLEYLVNHDTLTGLDNRYSMHQVIGRHLSLQNQESAVLLLIDLDRFKEINDTLGHHIGDQILQQLSRLLQSRVPYPHALVSRLGGDEFTIFIPQLQQPEEIIHFAEQLRSAIKKPFEIDSIHLEVDSSIGIAIYPQHGNTSHDLLRSADVAMYAAKAAGGGVAIYNPATDQHSHERLAIIGELGTAIRENQLRLHYQPKVDLHTQRITGFEALIRWQHPKLGLIYPDSFIPLAEVSDIIHPLTLEVINLAFRQQGEWIKSALSFSVAINISTRNLSDDNCVNRIQHLLQQSAMRPDQLELEITESALMKDPEGAVAKLNRIAALGVKITIDDFGTGFSSLAYLKKLPISTLKIDRSFVKDMLSNDKDRQIVQSTINLAHSLNIQVVAEGVEDQNTLESLQEMGCDMVQGYYYSKPLPWDNIASWMQVTTLIER